MHSGTCWSSAVRIKLSSSGGYYSKHDPNIVKDFSTKEYIDKKRASSIIIGGNLNNPVYAYTIYPIGDLPLVRHRSVFYAIKSEKLAKELGFEEDLFGGYFYNPKNTRALPSPIAYKPFKLPKFRSSSKSQRIKFGAESPSFKITEGKRYSFGIELETSAGAVPNYIAKDLNVECVYDGSIRDDDGKKRMGGEYVTGVLRGDAGMRHLYKITNELSKRCLINNTCSVHVHVGGVDFNKEMIVMLWKINQILEEELFAMMPPSRLTREHCKKMKHINFDLKKKGVSYDVLIDKYFNQIFKIISLGREPSATVNKRFNHPAGHSCGYNTSTPRYWWINFVPAMFNLKGLENYTIEFRQHSATLNFTKIKNWALIVFGIVYVAENHQELIASSKSMTIEEMLKLAYPSKWKYLSDYVDSRKELFASAPVNSMNEKVEYTVDRAKGSSDKTLRQTIWA